MPKAGAAPGFSAWGAYALALLGGLVTLALEMTLVRLLSPFFGATFYTWGAAITTIVLCIALGNFLGAELSARTVNKKHLLTGLLLASGLFQATVPLWGPAFLEAVATRVFLHGAPVMKINGVLFFVSLILAAPSLAPLCAVSPVLFALLGPKEEHPGRLAGRLMGLGTLGSCLGVLVANFVLVAYLGVKLSLLTLALFTLLGLVFTGLGLREKALSAGAALLFLLPGLTASRTPLKDHVTANPAALLLEEAETPYVYAQVFESGGFRYIGVNDGMYAYSKKPLARAGIYPFYTGSYWDIAMAGVMAKSNPELRHALVLGFGGGISYQLLRDHFPKAKVEAVEIDPVFARLAQEYFGVTPEKDTLHIADARPMLRSLKGPYDLIVLDVYHQNNIPFYLLTQECFQAITRLMPPDGLLAFNFAMPGENRGFLNRVLASLKPALPHQFVVPVHGGSNVIVLASAAPLTPRLALGRAMNVWRDKDETSLKYLASLAGQIARAEPALPGQAKPLTDDFAPAEQLTAQASMFYFREREARRKSAFGGRSKKS